MKEEKKPRLLVDVEDQLPTKAASKSLRVRAYCRRQQLICRLQPHLFRASQIFSCRASLLLLHRPETAATRAGRIGMATLTNGSPPKVAPPAWRWPGENEQHRAISGLFGLTRHWISCHGKFGAFLVQALKKEWSILTWGKAQCEVPSVRHCVLAGSRRSRQCRHGEMVAYYLQL